MLYRWFGGSNKVKSEYDEFKFDLESSEYEMRVVSSKKEGKKEDVNQITLNSSELIGQVTSESN